MVAGQWLQADLEHGLFMSARGDNIHPSCRGDPEPFVTALLKHNAQDYLALAAAGAQSGRLGPIHRGHEPFWEPGDTPMHQEAAIVLDTGRDNGNGDGSVGLSPKGVMTARLTKAATDDALRANIVDSGQAGLRSQPPSPGDRRRYVPDVRNGTVRFAWPRVEPPGVLCHVESGQMRIRRGCDRDRIWRNLVRFSGQ